MSGGNTSHRVCVVVVYFFQVRKRSSDQRCLCGKYVQSRCGRAYLAWVLLPETRSSRVGVYYSFIYLSIMISLFPFEDLLE
jgi:hypothetical protein